MPGDVVATTADGGGVIRYFRISNKDVVRWVGNNIDATPSGLQLLTVEKPSKIEVQEADKQTQSGYITIAYEDKFRLVLAQGSKLETGVGILRRLMELPAISAGGGARDAARDIADIVRSLISRVRVSITVTETPNIYRTPDDGGGTIVVLVTALSTIDGEFDPNDFGGVKFTATTRVDGGAQGPIPNTLIKDSESRPTAPNATTGDNFNFTIGDSAYVKLMPVGHKAIPISITLEADLAPVVSQDGVNELINKIKEQLRTFGLVKPNDNINTPQHQGQDNATFLQEVAGFGASLLGAFQEILKTILDSVKQRIIGALVTQTLVQFEYTEAVPAEVRSQLQLARAPDPAEKLYADFAIEERASTLDGEPGRSIRVIHNGNGKFAPELQPFIERLMNGKPFNQEERTRVAVAFPRAIHEELRQYSTEDIRDVAGKYRFLFALPKDADVRSYSREQLLGAFRKATVDG